MPNLSTVHLCGFSPIANLGRFRGEWLGRCRELRLRGTFLISAYGIHLFLAGATESLHTLVHDLEVQLSLRTPTTKWSSSRFQPFDDLKVRITTDLLELPREGISRGQRGCPFLPPDQLKRGLDESHPLILVDLRDHPSPELGSFRDARTLAIHRPQDLVTALRRLPSDLKTGPIVLLCACGIRSQHVAPFLEHEGFEHLFQLDGGMEAYLKKCGVAHLEGDRSDIELRVQRDGLADRAYWPVGEVDCFKCQSRLSDAEQRDPKYIEGECCPRCYKSDSARIAERLADRHQRILSAMSPLPGREARDQVKPVDIPVACDGGTLLEALCHKMSHVPSSYWESEFRDGRMTDVHGRKVSSEERVQGGDRYLHAFPQVLEPDVNPRLEILHEDEAIVVLNKPAPLPMHAGGRFFRNTLQYILDAVYAPEQLRPAHRLDANTTGIVLVTRSQRFAGRLQPQFSDGRIQKRYLVKVVGQPLEDEFACDAPISSESGALGSRSVDFAAGLVARTEFSVLRRLEDGTTLIEARPLTGRTNQIRIHLWHLGFPVVGDPVYLLGGTLGETQTVDVDAAPLCLHAWKIAFFHPLDGARTEFTAPPPEWAGGL